MRPARLPIDLVARLAFAAGGGLLLAAAVLTADAARLHMASLGAICGAAPAIPHCGWCLAAVGFGLAGLTALVLALRPLPERAAQAVL